MRAQRRKKKISGFYGRRSWWKDGAGEKSWWDRLSARNVAREFKKASRKAERRKTQRKPSMRIPIPQREKAAFIKLRRQGYTYNMLSKAFTRSTNSIYKTIHKAFEYGTLAWTDYRREKMCPSSRQRNALRRWAMLMRWLPQWTKWILGEEDKPP